ncbi:MAG: nickel-dependent hydrogenase large subunit, partial [Gammaproteobacteria bacterium]|nr:nickel-dependent hydrogenase large subunit [Gammaproteobacteria bacterium]
MTERKVSIHVPALTRVEGEGSLRLRIEQGRIEELALDIFEPPRYFEKFLEGRRHHEVLDIVARICGICPIAYQMSAVQALEAAFDIRPSAWVRDMRRLFYCGEWLQSHSLHIHLLAAPDFLGYDSVVGMAGDHGDVVRRGLKLQGLGNDLIRLLGGRSV